MRFLSEISLAGCRISLNEGIGSACCNHYENKVLLSISNMMMNLLILDVSTQRSSSAIYISRISLNVYILRELKCRSVELGDDLSHLRITDFTDVIQNIRLV